MQKTLKGPCGATLVLDSNEIIPDDPGAGTPAIVYYHGGSATFWCAIGEGEVEAKYEMIELPEKVLDWLNTIGNTAVEKMYAEFG